MFSKCLFVGLGGGAGAVCRYLAGMLPVLQQGDFTAFSLESLTLLEEGRLGMFTLYAALSLLLCIAGVALGKAVG